MKSMDLNSLQWFCLAVKAGSLAKAADMAGVSAPTMSRSLARLEDRIGLRLIHRSAKRFQLTADGEQYFAALLPALDHLEEKIEVLRSHTGELTGNIRISCPESLVTSLVHNWICEFLELHPKLNITILFALTEQFFVEDRLDLAIVVRPPTRKDIVQTRLISSQMWMAASPCYVQRNGHPKSAEDLNRFDLLCADADEKWVFIREKKNLVLHPKSRYCLSSMQCLVDAAVQGLGICNAPRVYVERLLENGKLVRLLDKERINQTLIYLILADRKLVPERVRALVNFFRQKARKL